MSRLARAVALLPVARAFALQGSFSREIARLGLRAAAVLAAGALGCVSEGELFERPGSAGGGTPVAALATLYATDPLRHTLDFETGDYGTILGTDGAYNRNSHLDFGFYQRDGFTVGIQGGELGVIVDLGDEETLSQDGGGSAFASLSLTDTTFSISAANAVFGPAQSTMSVPVVVGHVYVARIERSAEDGDIVVKWLAVDHASEQSAVIDWVRLR